MKTLDDLKLGQTGVVSRLGSSGALRRRIIDMGITPGATVKKLKTAPFGDVWSEYLKQSDIPENYFPAIQKYEEKVLKERT